MFENRYYSHMASIARHTSTAAMSLQIIIRPRFSPSTSLPFPTQDLEYPFQRPQIFHHESQYPAECVRWNPHLSHQDHVASTSEASIMVWRVDNDYRPLMAGLRKHKGYVLAPIEHDLPRI